MKARHAMEAWKAQLSDTAPQVQERVRAMVRLSISGWALLMNGKVQSHSVHESAKKRGEVSDETQELESTHELRGRLQQIEADLALSVNIDGNVIARYHRLSQEVSGSIEMRPFELTIVTAGRGQGDSHKAA